MSVQSPGPRTATRTLPGSGKSVIVERGFGGERNILRGKCAHRQGFGMNAVNEMKEKREGKSGKTKRMNWRDIPIGRSV